MKANTKVVVERKRKPFWQVVLIILAGIVIINYLITLCNLLGEKYAGIAGIVVILSSVLICARIINREKSSFLYTLDDDIIIFERIIGKRDDVLLVIKLDDIISVKPFKDVKEKNKKVVFTYKFVCTKEYERFYVGEFSQGSKQYRFVFEPNDRLLEVIKNRIEAKKI